MTLGTIGTDPDYASLLGGRQDPRLLMAQKLMDVGTMPTTNASQSSFWANLLNQGARGALGGYLYHGVQAERDTEATKQRDEAAEFRKLIEAGPPQAGSSPVPSSAPVKDGSGGAGTAPVPPAPAPQASLGGGGDLVAAVHNNESSGRMTPGIMGDGGQAFGPMQVHAGALADVNKAQGTNYTPQQLADNPELGRQVGAAYLKQMQAMFPDPALALAAYQAGPGTVRQAVASGQGLNGLPAHTQDYVRRALAFRGSQQADATPAPGSDMEALLRGVDAPKPRGIQLAENLVGGTATDAPTPILPDMGEAQGTAAPRLAVASAALPGPAASAPAMPSPAAASVPGPDLALPPPPAPADVASLASVNGVPVPSPAVVPSPDAASVPPLAAAVPPGAGPALVPGVEPALAPPPGLVPLSPAPPLPGADDPYVNQADVPPPPAPTPVLGNNAVPLQADTGAPPAAIVPPPAAATVPPGPVPDGGASRPDLPIPVPPIPPQGGPSGPQLAAPLVSGGGGNATEALNTASLAAARRGENLVPGGTASGPDRDARNGPLDLFAQAGLPSPYAGAPSRGIQLAGPLLPPGAPGAGLVTPTGDTTAAGAPGATTDTSAAGGPGKGAAPAAQASPAALADAQAKADWFLTMARQAQGSSNPRIRSQAGMLEAQGQALQRSVDRQTALNDRLAASREAASGRVQQQQDALAQKAAEGREQRRIELAKLGYRENPDGTMSTIQGGPQEGKTGEKRTEEQAAEDRGLALKGLRWKADSNRTVLEQIPNTSPPEGGTYAGTSVPGQDRNILDDLHDKIVKGTATEAEQRKYSRSYNALQNGTPIEIQDPQNPSRTIRVPGQPMDLTGYAPPPYRDTTATPGKPPSEAERVAGGFARRMDLTSREIDRIGTQSFGDVTAGRVPVVGNYLTSNQGQQFQTAAKAWVLAKLRKESGAAFGEGEWEREFSTYFPQPGDTPDRVALKKRLRDLETQNMQRDAGNAYTPPSEPAGGGGNPVRITDDAAGKQAMQSLKPGNQFIGPDGKTYRKN